MDLNMFFGAKKAKKAKKPVKKPVKKAVVKSPKGGIKAVGVVHVRGKSGKMLERKVFRGKKGGLFYKTKSGKTYVSSSQLKRKGSKTSPKRAPAKKPVKKAKKPTRYGYGLGQPSLIDMMGPAGLSVVPPAPVSANKFGYMNYY